MRRSRTGRAPRRARGEKMDAMGVHLVAVLYIIEYIKGVSGSKLDSSLYITR